MFEQYVGFGIMLLIAVGLGFALPFLNQILGPLRPTQKKLMPYESGMDPLGTARDRFAVKFYLTAMLFIVFDIEIIFMYPWAVQFKQLALTMGAFPLVEMFVFIAILFVGYIYLFKKGAFEWD